MADPKNTGLGSPGNLIEKSSIVSAIKLGIHKSPAIIGILLPDIILWVKNRKDSLNTLGKKHQRQTTPPSPKLLKQPWHTVII